MVCSDAWLNHTWFVICPIRQILHMWYLGTNTYRLSIWTHWVSKTWLDLGLMVHNLKLYDQVRNPYLWMSRVMWLHIKNAFFLYLQLCNVDLSQRHFSFCMCVACVFAPPIIVCSFLWGNYFRVHSLYTRSWTYGTKALRKITIWQTMDRTLRTRVREGNDNSNCSPKLLWCSYK